MEPGRIGIGVDRCNVCRLVSETQDAIDEQRRSSRVHAIRDRGHLVYLADQDDVSNHHRRVRRRHRPIHDVDDRVQRSIGRAARRVSVSSNEPRSADDVRISSRRSSGEFTSTVVTPSVVLRRSDTVSAGAPHDAAAFR